MKNKEHIRQQRHLRKSNSGGKGKQAGFGGGRGKVTKKGSPTRATGGRANTGGSCGGQNQPPCRGTQNNSMNNNYRRGGQPLNRRNNTPRTITRGTRTPESTMQKYNTGGLVHSAGHSHGMTVDVFGNGTSSGGDHQHKIENGEFKMACPQGNCHSH